MAHEDYVKTDKWFAWRPIYTTNAGWVWLTLVNRTIDERPEVYLGLLPDYTYTRANETIRKRKES